MNNWAKIAVVVLFPPALLYWLWTSKNTPKWVKINCTVFFAFLVAVAAVTPEPEPELEPVPDPAPVASIQTPEPEPEEIPLDVPIAKSVYELAVRETLSENFTVSEYQVDEESDEHFLATWLLTDKESGIAFIASGGCNVVANRCTVSIWLNGELVDERDWELQ